MVTSNDWVKVRFCNHVSIDATRRSDDMTIVNDSSAAVMLEFSLDECPETDLWSAKEKGSLSLL